MSEAELAMKRGGIFSVERCLSYLGDSDLSEGPQSKRFV